METPLPGSIEAQCERITSAWAVIAQIGTGTVVGWPAKFTVTIRFADRARLLCALPS